MTRSLAPMTPRKTYPPGVSCFIDTERGDEDAADAFYGGLFGWSFDEIDATRARRSAIVDGPGRRARRRRHRLGGIERRARRRGTRTSASRAPTRSSRAGRRRGRADVAGALRRRRGRPDGGRSPIPKGAAFRVWQAGRRPARSSSTRPGRGTGAISRLATSARPRRFTRAVFGWEYQEVDFGSGPSAMIRVPGYGDHLEALTPGTLAGAQGARRAGGLLGRDRLDAGARRADARRAGPSPSPSPTLTTPPPRPPALGGDRAGRAVRRPVRPHGRAARPRRRDVRDRRSSSRRVVRRRQDRWGVQWPAIAGDRVARPAYGAYPARMRVVASRGGRAVYGGTCVAAVARSGKSGPPECGRTCGARPLASTPPSRGRRRSSAASRRHRVRCPHPARGEPHSPPRLGRQAEERAPRSPSAHARPADHRGHLVRDDADAGRAVAAVLRDGVRHVGGVGDVAGDELPGRAPRC